MPFSFKRSTDATKSLQMPNKRLALKSIVTSCWFFEKQNRPTYTLTLFIISFQIDQEEIRPHGRPDFGRTPYVNRRKRSTTHLSQVEVVT